ncbi:MAG: MotA/TolQ/ExbB proton channel family protein [Anaerohalosphaeraceae bacterium]
MMILAAQSSAGQLSQTYFTQFVVAGGPIVWFILLPMSVAGIYFWLELCITIRRRRLLPPDISSEIATVAQRHGTASLPARFSGNTDMISRAVCAAFAKTRKIRPTHELLSQIAGESLQEQGLKLLRKTEWCNLLGNVAPMVGLFGTVWGMIEAFNLLGIAAGQPRPGELASAISVALVTTFWGLLVAIPSLFIAGMFRSRIEAFIAEAAVETETLLETLLEARQHQAGTGGKPSGSASKSSLDAETQDHPDSSRSSLPVQQ